MTLEAGYNWHLANPSIRINLAWSLRQSPRDPHKSGDQDGDEQGREKPHLLAELLAGRWFDSTDRLVRRQVEFRELVDRQRTNLALERGFGNRAHLEGQRHGLGGQALF